MKIKKAAKPVLTIGMIVKNEIRCLERCLKSLEPLRKALPCELIIADTGSDDGTREVAEKYADLVFDFEWINDFAAARNAVVDKASGEWFLSVDADEWLEGEFADLVDFLQHPEKYWDKYQSAVVLVRNYSGKELNKSVYSDFLASRLFRRTAGIRYEGAIHETPAVSGGARALNKTIFYHDGYIGLSHKEGEAKRQRNIELLRKKLADNPDDVRTLLQCVESSTGEESQRYLRQAIDAVLNKCEGWDRSGPSVFLYEISEAQKHDSSDFWDLVNRAQEWFSQSIVIRVDVNFQAFQYARNHEDFAATIKWAKDYLNAMEDYRAGRYNINDLTRATLYFATPLHEQSAHVYLADTYYHEKDYSAALEKIEKVDLIVLRDDILVVAFCILMNLHNKTDMDIASAFVNFWDKISTPEPDIKSANQRKATIMVNAARAFSPKYQEKEQEEGFLRPSYKLFCALGESCELGIAAEIIETEDAEQIEGLLAKVEDWQLFPIHALAYAIDSGAAFPIPGKVLPMETLDFLAGKLAGVEEDWLVKYCLSLEDAEDLNWTRALLLAAVQTIDTEKSDSIMELVQRFADFERTFLPYCYAPAVLAEEGQPLLPPIHRFGSALADAFAALDTGDKAGYVRHIREGLVQCESMKPLAEYLCEQVKSWQKPSPELQALAEQIKTILAAYPEDDPAVVAIRQSEAYQKVAWLLESPSEQ